MPAVVPATVVVPAGRLETMGSDGTSRVLPIDSFRLGRTPVTNREYAPFVAAAGALTPPWWNDPDFCAPEQPVVGVTWPEATAYCGWLSECGGGRWRLPTEAEWEFAACGGLVAPRTAWGDAIPPEEIPEGPITAPWQTGRGTPNRYGLLDIGTIVHEWCLDWREGLRPGATPRRASRGGSWRHEIRWSSPGATSSLPPDCRYSDFGFRVLHEIDL